MELELLQRARDTEPLDSMPDTGAERRALRRGARLSQEAMASLVGCSKTAIQRYEAGDWSPQALELEYRYRQCLALCAALGAEHK